MDDNRRRHRNDTRTEKHKRVSVLQQTQQLPCPGITAAGDSDLNVCWNAGEIPHGEFLEAQLAE
jgi:hypothetical protein